MNHAHRSNFKWYAFALSGLLALLAFLPSILQNEVFLARDDFFNQQIPFIIQSKRLLLTHGLYQWDWTTFLGADFLASYSFYNLGSPFFWILLPLPDSAMLWGIGLTAILKHAVAGLGAFLYLKLFVQNDRFALLGGLFYVFSGFTIVNVDFNHFTDVIALFPLLLWQVEKVAIRHASSTMLMVIALLNALTNYYFFVSSLIFIFLYLWLRKVTLRQFIGVAWALGVGILLAGFVFLPIAMEIWDSPRVVGHDLFAQLLRPIFPTNYLERIRVFLMPIESHIAHPFFPKTYSWKSTAAYLPVVGFVFVWAFLRTNRKHWLTKLLWLLALASFIPPFTGVFSLGTNPDYTRWWYALVLMMSLASVLVLEENKIMLPQRAQRYAIWMTGLAMALTLPALLFHYLFLSHIVHLGPLQNIMQSFYSNSVFGVASLSYLALGLASINFTALFAILNVYRKSGVFPLNISLVLVSLCAVVNYGAIIYYNNNALYSSADSIDRGQDYYRRVLVEHPAKSRPVGFITQRIDHPLSLENFGTLVNAPSISAFNSVRSKYISQYAEQAGFGSAQYPAARPPEQDSALRAILSVGEFQQFDSANPDSLRINPYRLPIGLSYEYYEVNDSLSGMSLSQQMLSAIMINGSDIARFQGYLAPVPDSLRRASWTSLVAMRRLDTCRYFRGDAHGFTAQWKGSKKRMLFFSVPFHPGWKAYLDGMQTPIQKVNIGFMGVLVSPGEHDVRFEYHTRGKVSGIALSIMGLFLFVVTSLVQRRVRRDSTHNTSTNAEHLLLRK